MCTDLRQRGMTLVELIIAIVIIAVAIAGVLGVYNAAVKGSSDPIMDKQAFAIAEALVEEVQLAPFTYCDPADPVAETAASAADCTVAWSAGARPFDNVSKYNGLTLNPYIDLNGVTVAGYAASVSVSAAALGALAAGSGEVLRIRVTVTSPMGQTYRLDGYRTRYAPNATP